MADLHKEESMKIKAAAAAAAAAAVPAGTIMAKLSIITLGKKSNGIF
jgi:hypothetical protein